MTLPNKPIVHSKRTNTVISVSDPFLIGFKQHKSNITLFENNPSIVLCRVAPAGFHLEPNKRRTKLWIFICLFFPLCQWFSLWCLYMYCFKTLFTRPCTPSQERHSPAKKHSSHCHFEVANGLNISSKHKGSKCSFKWCKHTLTMFHWLRKLIKHVRCTAGVLATCAIVINSFFTKFSSQMHSNLWERVSSRQALVTSGHLSLPSRKADWTVTQPLNLKKWS